MPCFLIVRFDIAQSFEVSAKDGERSFEFVACIGDEVAPHLVGDVDVGLFMEGEEGEGLHAVSRREGGGDMDMEVSLDGDMDSPVDVFNLAVFLGSGKSI